MNANQLSVATITWARSDEEELLLRAALTQLSLMQMPVYVTDGGSKDSFVQFLHSLPNFTVINATGKGLWNQVQAGLQAAMKQATGFTLYTEPDKLLFFEEELANFVNHADDVNGIMLAARTKDAFATFPSFQQTTETCINFCCSEVTQHSFDYTYGPFILNNKLIPYFKDLPINIDWGWRTYAFCAAHRLGYKIQEIQANNICPFDQRSDSVKERIYRMKQLHQNIEGVVLATTFNV